MTRSVETEGLRSDATEPYAFRHSIDLDLATVVEVAARHRGDVEAHRATIPLIHPSGGRRRLAEDSATLVAGLADNNSWITLFGVDDDVAIRPIAAAIKQDLARVGRADAWIVLSLVCSSPKGITPVHLDSTDVLLMQLVGTKTFSTGSIASRKEYAEQLRRRFVGEENMSVLPEVQRDWKLVPGVAAFLPAYTPHWAIVGSEVSVALSVTIRSPALRHREAIHRADAALVRRGLRLPAPERFPLLDEARLSVVTAGSRLVRKVRSPAR